MKGEGPRLFVVPPPSAFFGGSNRLGSFASARSAWVAHFSRTSQIQLEPRSALTILTRSPVRRIEFS